MRITIYFSMALSKTKLTAHDVLRLPFSLFLPPTHTHTKLYGLSGQQSRELSHCIHGCPEFHCGGALVLIQSLGD